MTTDPKPCIYCRQPESNSAPSPGFQSQETRTQGQPDARWVTKWDKFLSLKLLNWPFCLKKCSIFAYFRRELETSYFGEDGKRSPILERTCITLSQSERDLLILRQFRADLVVHPSIRCSNCNKEFRRKLYQDFHWCEVAKRGYSRYRKIQLGWESEWVGTLTPWKFSLVQGGETRLLPTQKNSVKLKIKTFFFSE
jgi:hypothetical protein